MYSLVRIFTVQSTTSDYLAANATCISLAKYHYSCEICGALSTDVFESGELAPHTPNGQPTYTEAQLCTICGKLLQPVLNRITLTPEESDQYNGGTTGITFYSSENIKEHYRVTIDEVELDPDEYKISKDGMSLHIEPHAINLILPYANHTLKVYVSGGIAECSFSFYPESPDINNSRTPSFGFWAVLICVIALVTVIFVIYRRKTKK